MVNALVAEDHAGDAERICAVLRSEGVEPLLCSSGVAAEAALRRVCQGHVAVFLSAEIPGPPFGFELIIRFRKAWPETPVVVLSGALDASLAVRAAGLGATTFLGKPIDDVRLRQCLRDLISQNDPLQPVVARLREVILGEGGEQLVGNSPAFLNCLRQLAPVIAHPASRILILGESGTGKELIARAIHRVWGDDKRPWVAVNIAETPANLVETALFGNEKGAFTDARERRIGFLEQAGRGTLFLDEIGDLDMSLQVKLLRAIQEREFRRVGGNTPLKFEARLIAATNRDLAQAVHDGTFRSDLYHRIAEVVIDMPALRDREGDIELLLQVFLDRYGRGRSVRLSREAAAILRSYSFPGNVRELENVVKGALIQSQGQWILPEHLPLAKMEKFLKSGSPKELTAPRDGSKTSPFVTELLDNLKVSLPSDLEDLPHKAAVDTLLQAFDRIYLKRRWERKRYKVKPTAISIGMDAKTFRKHWEDCGLPPLKETGGTAMPNNESDEPHEPGNDSDR